MMPKLAETLVTNVLLLLFGTCSRVVSQDCTLSTVNKCLSILSNGELASSVIPWYSTAVVIDNCRRLQPFNDCMKTVTPYCKDDDRLLYQGISDAYDYLCNSGFQDYEQYQPCFADSGVQSEANFCNNTLSIKLDSLKSVTNVTYKRARLCQYADDYLDCVGNVVKSFCSVGAETWQRKYDLKQLCPLLVAQGCPGWTTQCHMTTTTTQTPLVQTTGWFMIVLSVSVAVVIVVIIVSLVILICYRCRSHRSRSPRPSFSSGGGAGLGDAAPRFDMPPPYPGPFIPCGVASALNLGYSDDEAVAAAAAASSSSETSSDMPQTTVDEMGAVGGADPDDDWMKMKMKKQPIPDDDDEGHFVPDAVDMDAKLAQVIPPPAYIHHDTEQVSRHSTKRQRSSSHHQKRQHGTSADNSGSSTSRTPTKSTAAGSAPPSSASSSWSTADVLDVLPSSFSPTQASSVPRHFDNDPWSNITNAATSVPTGAGVRVGPHSPQPPPALLRSVSPVFSQRVLSSAGAMTTSSTYSRDFVDEDDFDDARHNNNMSCDSSQSQSIIDYY